MNTLKTKILFLARSKILQHLFRFGRLYKLFSWLIIGLIASIILSLLKRSIDVDWVLSIFSLTAIIFLLLGTLRSIRAGIYCVEIPALIAIIMAIVLGQYWASFIVTLVLVGRQPLEGLAALQASRHRAELSKHLPISAQLLRKHKIISVQVSDLIINDKIILQIGDIVPVDAVILEGSGNFDESILSGEIKHQLKSVGDQILSGSINTDGTITAKVIRTSMESQHHQIIQITRSAVASSSPIIKRLDRYSIFFILSSFIIGGAAWAITGHPLRFLEVIIVAAPSSFILAPTIALVTGMNRALREGIIVKTGRVFEKLADAKTITFNKTSLMSTEAPKVDNIVAFKPFTKQEVLIYAGSVQQRSNNILARAVTAEVTSNKLRLLKAKHVQEITGSGLEARINNKEIVIGRLELIQKRNITIPEQFKPKQITQTVTFIAINGELAGYITFTDSLRPGIKSTLITLAGLGVLRVLLVTTDHQTAATQFAKRLGITDIKAEAHPGDELHAMESIEERPVIFIGSGITDSTALTAADVGIIIGASGQTAASHAADVIIMKDDLSYAARAIILAKWSFHIIKQSVAIGVGISIALMLISVTGLIAPVTGAIIREIIDVIIILNALRPRMAPYAS